MRSCIAVEKNGQPNENALIKNQATKKDTLVSQENKRQRGLHSTSCLNPKPVYIRPKSWKNLPGELGKTFNFCRTRDISRDPHFVYLRQAVGRQRDFKKVRRDLINPFFQLCLSRHDLVTGIIELDLEAMATELSKMWIQNSATEEQYLVECKVTISRISRFIEEVMIPFGFAYVHAESEHDRKKNGLTWDNINGFWYPKILVLTDEFYRVAGANIEKINIQREQQLTFRNAGITDENELITLKEARIRKQKQIFKRAWNARKQNTSARRQRNKLGKMNLDDRKYAIAMTLASSIQTCELTVSDSKEFNKLVWSRLYSMNVEIKRPPIIPI
ncbi:plasmid replication initiator RepA [Shewanella sp. YLB-07]|uniref:plasmid replication initiator RepA n=1 Tax=Shewanella sp. YLB-07 TaxID=2601268 RepID=UPI00128CC502|nr:plasmid replication initiator RepA [Shewanella sp. YLB-07]MPY24392.1 hypothetical protein [Shewanella sp. YLB-07]